MYLIYLYMRLILFIASFVLLSIVPTSYTVGQLVLISDSLNECYELNSVVFRLAGSKEFNEGAIPSYNIAVDEYFAPFKQHEAVLYSKYLRDNLGIGYDAIGIAAVHMDIKDNQVGVKKGICLAQIAKMDNRWSECAFRHYVELVDDFYKQSHYHDFYQQYAFLYYEKAKHSLEEVLKHANLSWLRKMLGQQNEIPFYGVPSISSGPNNYGFSYMQNDTLKQGFILGCGFNGTPFYKIEMVSILVHEIIHNTVNPIVDTYWTQLKDAANRLFPLQTLENSAYNTPKRMMYEWLTRLFELYYIHENRTPELSTMFNPLIDYYQKLGFIGIKEALDNLISFANVSNRDICINDYMPQLILFIQQMANKN